MIITMQLALRARWLFYRFISNSGSWNNCSYIIAFALKLLKLGIPSTSREVLDESVYGMKPLFNIVFKASKHFFLSAPEIKVNLHFDNCIFVIGDCFVRIMKQNWLMMHKIMTSNASVIVNNLPHVTLNIPFCSYLYVGQCANWNFQERGWGISCELILEIPEGRRGCMENLFHRGIGGMELQVHKMFVKVRKSESNVIMCM